MKKNTRRFFIKTAAVGGLSFYSISATGFRSFIAKGVKNENLKKGAVILFQGDSITDGNRGRNEDPNHIMGHGYAFSIASRIGADYPEKNYRFINRGISGNKIIDLENRWQKDTLDLQPDLLSFLIGVNDSSSVVFNWKPVINIEKYRDTFNSLMQQTKAQFPKIQIVICEPFILKVGNVAENWEKYHNDIIQRQKVVHELSERYDCVFVSFQKVFDDACKKAPASYWTWDGIHPTVAGHELMAREWLKQVEKRISF